MELTLRQKIGQLVLYSMESNEITPETRALIQQYCIGNVIHFGNNVTDFSGSKALNSQLRELIKESCAGVEPWAAQWAKSCALRALTSTSRPWWM